MKTVKNVEVKDIMCSFMDIDKKKMKKIVAELRLERVRKLRSSFSPDVKFWARQHWKKVEDAVRQQKTDLTIKPKKQGEVIWLKDRQK